MNIYISVQEEDIPLDTKFIRQNVDSKGWTRWINDDSEEKLLDQQSEGFRSIERRILGGEDQSPRAQVANLFWLI